MKPLTTLSGRAGSAELAIGNLLNIANRAFDGLDMHLVDTVIYFTNNTQFQVQQLIANVILIFEAGSVSDIDLFRERTRKDPELRTIFENLQV